MESTSLVERLQVVIYGVAVVCGIALGSASVTASEVAGIGILPVLTVLLYATFLQVRVGALPGALGDHRFLAATLAGNFIAVPLLVAGMLALMPLEPALRVGVVIVLLAPCTDWFSSFTHLGRGDTRLAIAATPLLLALQLPLLPVYLWLLTDLDFGTLTLGPILRAVVFVILVPLSAAALTQRLPHARAIESGAARMLVPFLAVTLFMVAISEASAVHEAGDMLGRVVLLFAAYVVAAAALARLLARLFGLGIASGRTLAFNLGTRNSFVVLPLALALPEGFALAAPAVAAQTLVELVGMTAYLRWVPARLFPDRDQPPMSPANSSDDVRR